MSEKADPKWTTHKEMTNHKGEQTTPKFAKVHETIPPVHTFALLNTPFGADVEQTIETAEEYTDRA
jgi:hypothetical protein